MTWRLSATIGLRTIHTKLVRANTLKKSPIGLWGLSLQPFLFVGAVKRWFGVGVASRVPRKGKLRSKKYEVRSEK